MKVLIVNGSPHAEGNTAVAIKEMTKVFDAAGVEYDIIQIGHQAIRGCIACGKCAELGKCVFDDAVNEAAEKFAVADGLVIASPVYYASANGTVASFLDRLFFSCKAPKAMKVGAAVAVARRGGLTATYDQLNKYFGITGMPIATSQYWNGLHGHLPGEGAQDGEGLQTMRYLAQNMVFLMQSIALGKEKYGIPQREPWIKTNLVR